MKRKSKAYLRPKHLYEKERIQEENLLAKKYGLKNKTEIWKSIAQVSYFRRRAKALVKESYEEQKAFFEKLSSLGFKVNKIVDVLALRVEDLLERRLSTIVVKKKIATTPKQARQMITHKRILIDGKAINVPSYIVSVHEEGKIQLRTREKKLKAEVKTENEIPEQTPAQEAHE